MDENIENTNYVLKNNSQNLNNGGLKIKGSRSDITSRYKLYFNIEENTTTHLEKPQGHHNLQAFKEPNVGENKKNQEQNCLVVFKANNRTTLVNNANIKKPIHQYSLYGSTNNSIVNDIKHNHVPIESCTESDTYSSENSFGLNKLQQFTAVDFHHDRYAHYSIHESEIKDYVRTISFKNCFHYCAESNIKDKVVLVVRCGIGLIPMLCVQFGFAKRVIAFEQSACIEYARQVIKDNNFQNKITLIQSSIHDLKRLPHGLTKVDVIVSDFMGECLLSQGDQMEQVIEARDRFLKPNGIMIPKSVSLYFQLLEQRCLYANQRIYKNSKNNKPNSTDKKKLDKSLTVEYDSDSSTDSTNCSWWSNVYGFDMRIQRDFIVIDDCNYSISNTINSSVHQNNWCIMPEPVIQFFDPCKVVSNCCLIKEFDMYTCTINEVQYLECKNLKLDCNTPYTSANGGDYGHMLEIFMIVDFPNGYDMCKNNDDVQIGFCTSSFSPFTRYKQTGLLLRDQLLVNNGDRFILNELHIWRGPQKNSINKMFDRIISSKNYYGNSNYEQNLKFRLSYTFMNKYIQATNRQCLYILNKYLF